MKPLNSKWGGGKIMWFTKVFYQHIMFRHSCGNCHYCNTQRPSDITIADFWGWEKTDPVINQDDKGLSLLLVNTEKGRRLFEAIQGDINVIPAKLENCLQPNLQHSSLVHPKRMQFEKDYADYGFEYVYNKDYNRVGFPRRIARKIKSILRRLLK